MQWQRADIEMHHHFLANRKLFGGHFGDGLSKQLLFLFSITLLSRQFESNFTRTVLIKNNSDSQAINVYLSIPMLVFVHLN